MGAADPRGLIPAAPALAAGAVVGHLLPGLCAWSATARAQLGVAARLPSDHGVALTFDDGPHPEGTPAVLELLRDARAMATFFVVGAHAARWPALVAEIAAAGHEVAVHGSSHRDLAVRTPHAVHDDLRRAGALVAELSGAEPRLWRPPHGVVTSAGLLAARSHRWLPLLWSRWGRDWRRAATPASVVADASAGLRPGAVVLLHDADHHSAHGSWRTTVAALPAVLEAVARAGTAPVAWPAGRPVPRGRP